MRLTSKLILGTLLGVATAAPDLDGRNALKDRSTLVPRGTFCEQYANETYGNYVVFNNLWGKDDATSGSQCTTVSGGEEDTVVWSTSWTWFGNPLKVKSYANAVVGFEHRPLSAVSTIPSTWKWTYTGDQNLIADVAYDMFTADALTSDLKIEVMVWLAQIGGAGPISYTYGADGRPTPWQKVNIGGKDWDVFKGPNNQLTVYSFLPPQEIREYQGDMKEFFSWLISLGEIPDWQILRSVGAGTEPFEGSNAVFSVLEYSASVN